MCMNIHVHIHRCRYNILLKKKPGFMGHVLAKIFTLLMVKERVHVDRDEKDAHTYVTRAGYYLMDEEDLGACVRELSVMRAKGLLVMKKSNNTDNTDDDKNDNKDIIKNNDEDQNEDDDENELDAFISGARDRLMVTQALSVIRSHIQLLTLMYDGKNAKIENIIT